MFGLFLEVAVAGEAIPKDTKPIAFRKSRRFIAVLMILTNENLFL